MSPGYLLRRLLGAVPLLLAISLLLFSIVHLAPGGPLDVYADNPSVTPQALAQIKVAYGLDKPVPVQYLLWVKSMAQGMWGYSIRTGRPVTMEIAERLPATLLLGGTALALSLVLALPIGILTAALRRTAVDHVLTFLSFAGISIPVFWLRLMMQLLFGITLGVLPAAGYETIGAGGVADRLAHLVMPAVVLALATIASWSRFLRASMVDAMKQDYIRTAFAKGHGMAGRTHQTRVTQCPDPRGDHHFHGPGERHLRRGDHRDRVRVARHRPAVRREHGWPRLPRAHGLMMLGVARAGARQLDGRHRVRRDRPADSL